MTVHFFGAGYAGRRTVIPVVAVLALFFVAAVARYSKAPGDDLAASYIGCRLIATHDTADLYSYDPDTFSDINSDDGAWHAVATQSGFTGYLHPYVQTPLWAWSLQPLCTHLRFVPFRFVFNVVSLLSFFGVLWLVARFWTPSLLTPLAMTVLLLAFYRSEPFRYSMVLMQTHVLYYVLTISGLLLAERRRPWLAGALLALAAAVKITPGFLIVYWLLTRRYRAALAATLASAVLLAATIVITGPALFHAYLSNLHRISNVLLVSENNQSFAAWLMGRYHPDDQLDELVSYALPPALRIGSNLLVLASLVFGGLMDRRLACHSASPADNTSVPPLGAMVAILGGTLFTPIAWTHYYIVLFPPVMMLLHQFHTASAPRLPTSVARRPWWLVGAVLVIAALNIRPVAPDVVKVYFGPASLVRSTFYSGVLCLVTLAFAAWQRRRNLLPIACFPETSYPEHHTVPLTTVRQDAPLPAR